jgi:hypothetical protein
VDDKRERHGNCESKFDCKRYARCEPRTDARLVRGIRYEPRPPNPLAHENILRKMYANVHSPNRNEDRNDNCKHPSHCFLNCVAR